MEIKSLHQDHSFESVCVSPPADLNTGINIVNINSQNVIIFNMDTMLLHISELYNI